MDEVEVVLVEKGLEDPVDCPLPPGAREVVDLVEVHRDVRAGDPAVLVTVHRVLLEVRLDYPVEDVHLVTAKHEIAGQEVGVLLDSPDTEG